MKYSQLGTDPRAGDLHPERHRQQGRRHRGQPARPGRAGAGRQKAVAPVSRSSPINAGDRDWQKTGALSFFGEPEVLAGEFAGTKLNEIGSKHTLCVLQAQGQIQLEDRCDGITSKFSGTTDRLFADGTDPAALRLHRLRQARAGPDASTRSSPSGRNWVSPCQKQLEQDGVARPRSSPTRSTRPVPLLQSGKVAFTIDQQPCLQGYLAIDSLWLYKLNNSVLGAQLSSPDRSRRVDKNNIGAIVPFIQAGLR